MASPKRSQNESEQPAKVYQLDAVDSKVEQALGMLNKVLEQTSGLATQAELIALEKSIREYVDDEVKKVHLEYGPMKKNATWFVRLVIGAIVGQMAIIAWIANFYRG